MNWYSFKGCFNIPKAQFVECQIGWGKFPTGGVKGVSIFTPGVKVIKVSQRHRRLSIIHDNRILFLNSIVDAIGILVGFGKSIKKWLEKAESGAFSQGFRAWRVHRSGW
ncbi:MAG: hypothetical protein NC341_09185 [Blautia sp.]|nr:hypothetical protein [Blautia sp.]MCM1201890.1 hypothetical protein [Bacteroides fragilis]